MAYMNQERKAKIVAAAKPILAKYGMKATFKCRQHSINCTLRAGAIDFFSDLVADFGVTQLREWGHYEINPHWYHDRYTGKAKAFLDEFLPAMKAADWYDRSDAMVDYFDTAYYWSVYVGSWNKPYVCTEVTQSADQLVYSN